jgi:hypothetical protein
MSSSIGQSPTLLLSATLDEIFILSWIIDIGLIENCSASDNNCNTIICDPSKNLQGMRNNVGLTFSIEQDN